MIKSTNVNECKSRNTRRLILVSVIIMVILYTVHRANSNDRLHAKYEDRTLTEWLNDYEGAQVPGNSYYTNQEEIKIKCSIAINAMGTNALPELMLMLHSKDSAFKQKALSLAQSVCHIHYILPAVKHHMAYQGIQMLGTNALPAAPDLALMMKRGEDGERFTALEMLEDMGAWEILKPALIAMFQNDPDAGLREIAAHELVHLFPSDADGVGVYSVFPRLEKVRDANAKPREH